MAHALALTRRRLLQSLPGLCLPAAALGSQPSGEPGFALYDRPKYGPDFTHFDYVNPAAPVGGSLWLTPPTVATNFDQFNPFTLRGIAAPGLGTLMFESLMVSSWDEPDSVYGLLAQDIEPASDGRSVRFVLNPAARFNNGDPVTAADVVHSFQELSSSRAAPAFQAQLAGIRRAVAEGPRQVRFEFASNARELPLIAASLPVFSVKWGAGKAFDRIAFEPPITSGPYRIDHMSEQRDIVYARRPDYWGWNLPSRRGQFNFSRIGYKLYGDPTARLEAFRAGEFDLVQEFIARNWVRQYRGPGFDRGELIKRSVPNHNPAGFQGFVFNLRRELFQDARVRQALALALDFDWLNRMLFYGQYRRIQGYFANSEFSASGRPGADELEYLEPLRGLLPTQVFGDLPRIPGTNPPGSQRANLLAARELLRQAGWNWRDGALRNAAGRAFSFEYTDAQSALLTVAEPYRQALGRLGIALNLRILDLSVYQERMDNFDFDMTTVRWPGSPSPGSELPGRFGSAAASQTGSDNFWGLRSAAVDALIQRVLEARTRAQLRGACRALDRTLVCSWCSVPHWYSPVHRIAYRAHAFGMPGQLPLYFEPETWAATCWWALPGQAGGDAR